MDRRTAAAVLGVAPDVSRRRLTQAYRARVRATHPDRFPPGSEAWEDANHALVELNEAVRVLGLPEQRRPGGRPAGTGPSGPTATSASGTSYDAVPSWERGSEGFRTPDQSDRLARAWGYGWGAFLLLSAVLSALVGAQQTTNDAFPVWTPALAIIGVTAVVIGARADARLRRRGTWSR